MPGNEAISSAHVEGVLPLLDLLHVGFVVIGPDGEVRHATTLARRLLGARRLDGATLRALLGELHAGVVAPILAVPPGARAGAEHHFETARASIDVGAALGRDRRARGTRRGARGLRRLGRAGPASPLDKDLLGRQEAINDELRTRIAQELREHEDDLAQFREAAQVAPAIRVVHGRGRGRGRGD